MTRLWSEAHAIEVQVDGEGRPCVFVWQERRYQLHHIHQRWDVDTDWWHVEGRVWRSYWAAHTVDGLLCVLYQDRLADAWYLAKLYD